MALILEDTWSDSEGQGMERNWSWKARNYFALLAESALHAKQSLSPGDFPLRNVAHCLIAPVSCRIAFFKTLLSKKGLLNWMSSERKREHPKQYCLKKHFFWHNLSVQGTDFMNFMQAGPCLCVLQLSVLSEVVLSKCSAFESGSRLFESGSHRIKLLLLGQCCLLIQRSNL